MTDKKKRFPEWLRTVPLFILLCVLGGICGYLGLSLSEQFIPDYASPWSVLLLPLLLYAAFLLQIILHEAGHWCFGAMTGYRCYSFRIFNLCFVMLDGKVQLRRMSLPGTGGQCLMAPPDLHDGKMPCLLYNLGGVLMNLLTAVLCLLLSRIAFGWLAAFLIMMCVAGACFALTNGIPLHMQGLDNDGYNALSLCRSPAAQRALWIQLKISEMTYRGVRLRDMPEEWFQLPSEDDTGNALLAALAVFAENRLMDEQRFEEAAQLIDRLTVSPGAIPGIYLALLTADRIYCELMGEQRREVLDQLQSNKLYQKIAKQMKSFPSILRTNYAVALLDTRDEAKAKDIYQQFKKVAAAYPAPADIASEWELIALAQQKAHEN